MSKLSTVLFTAGLILVLFVYVLLYTPLYEMIWGYQPPKEYQPQADLTKRPIQPRVITKAATAEATPTKEAVAGKKKPEPPAAEKIKIEEPKKPAPPPKFVNLRDPFVLDFSIVAAAEEPATPSAPPKPKATLVLQGIFVSGTVKSAIIDDKIVSVGTSVARGFKVYDIREDSVILKKGSAYKTLSIKGGI